MTLAEIKALPVGSKFKYKGWDAQKMSPDRIKVKFLSSPAPVYISIKDSV